MSVCVGSAWKIILVTACSLWSVLGGGGRESPVKHGAGGAQQGGHEGGTGEEGPCPFPVELWCLSSTFKTWKAGSQKWDLTFRPS